MMIKNWLILEKDDLDKKIRHYSVYRFLLLISAIIGFFASLLLLWPKTHLSKMAIYDQTVIKLITRINNQTLINFFSVVTGLGNSYFIIAIFLILAFMLVQKRRKRAAFVSLLTLLGSYSFIHFFKHFFGRPRPFGCEGNDCFSFPSGHSTMATYFYGLLDYLVFRFFPTSLKTFSVFSFLVAFIILLISASRLFLGLHFLSDIFAGFFLGGAWLLVAVLLIDILYHQV